MNKVDKVNNIIVFLGPPGSGKGTLSKLCVKRLGWTQFSTGNLCREHIANKTEIGKKIDFIIKSGKLISDSLITEMVKEWLFNQFQKQTSVIFDGFPRTKVQALALNDILYSSYFNNNKIRLYIVNMSIPDSSIVFRLSNRMVCSNEKCQTVYSLSKELNLKPKKENICDECLSLLIRRKDDEEITVRERLKIYRMHEENIISYFQDSGYKIINLPVERPLEAIYQDFLTKLSF